ncbi:hypothetical protein ACLBOM_24745 [Escherichia coli]
MLHSCWLKLLEAAVSVKAYIHKPLREVRCIRTLPLADKIWLMVNQWMQ